MWIYEREREREKHRTIEQRSIEAYSLNLMSVHNTLDTRYLIPDTGHRTPDTEYELMIEMI